MRLCTGLRLTPQRFGWLPDPPDQRDLLYALPFRRKKLPSRVDLRPQCPPIYDQKDLGSCTAQDAAFAHQFAQMKQGAPGVFLPSRLFIYLESRRLIDQVDVDSGAHIRDAFKVIAKLGAPPESLWPYDIDKFKDAPPKRAYDEALDHQAIRYMRLSNTRATLQGCLAEGYPVCFGASLYDSFMRGVYAGGMIPMPGKSESLVGGHAMAIVGFWNLAKRYLVRTSWGTRCGEHGCLWMPYDYVESRELCDDFWTLRLVEVPAHTEAP